MDPIDPEAIQALMNRKAQLLAQEQMAMNGQPQTTAPQAAPAQGAMGPMVNNGMGAPGPQQVLRPQMQPMQQAQMSGYGAPGAVINGQARPAPSPQQLQQLAALLQRRAQ